LFDTTNGPSPVETTLEQLKADGFVKFHDDAWWIKTQEQGHDEKDRVVIKADGSYTYFASDIAYHKNKFDRGYDELIDIWGADHHGYVPRIKATIGYCGNDPDALTVILYQLVSLKRHGEKVAMSTRAGKFITLTEVVDEVGVDACRFFLLMRSGDNTLEFDVDLALKHTNENPVYYIQYAHARIKSIFREAATTYDSHMAEANETLHTHLADTEAQTLMKTLSRFPDVVTLCAREHTPHHIPTYLLDLAATFHGYYTKHRILVESDPVGTAARLMLVQATAQVIHNGLDLLGISAPERM
jgi:arginyl-tRNA synthetase